MRKTGGTCRVDVVAMAATVAIIITAAVGVAQGAGAQGTPSRTDISPTVPEGQLAPHGALAEAEQEQRFDALVKGRAVATRPKDIDPVVWAELVPKDNAMTPERVALGRKLYFDPKLSADGTVSCATCHDVSRGFTDQRPTSEGIHGQLGKRNAPTTLNALFLQTQFLDGRAASLEKQAELPLVNPIEMGQPNAKAVERALAAEPAYAPMFQAAYGHAPNYTDTGKAIAAFERTLVFLDSPFRRFVAGDQSAISESAKRGWILYNGKARCVSCHPISPTNPVGTDNRFHNLGVAALHQDFEGLAVKALTALAKDGGIHEVDRLALETDMSELGRFLVTKDRADIGAFKTLQVTNVGITAPYMHDGSMRTLWDVVDHYNKGGDANPFLDGGIEPLALTEAEVNDLVAFLFTLTDDRLAADNAREEAAQRHIAIDEGKRPFRDDALAQRKVLPFEQRVQGTPAGKE